MKENTIKETLSTILVASQAQAFFMAFPMIAGVMIGSSVNTSITRSTSRYAALDNSTKIQYLTDINAGMSQENALAKGCFDYPSARCVTNSWITMNLTRRMKLTPKNWRKGLLKYVQIQRSPKIAESLLQIAPVSVY